MTPEGEKLMLELLMQIAEQLNDIRKQVRGLREDFGDPDLQLTKDEFEDKP